MKLQLRNIGMIKEADVRLDGLTVIAGENDTGKSTVGKALFCAVKSSVMSSGKFFYRNRDRYILGRLFENLKNIISLSSKDAATYARLAKKVNDVKEEIEKLLKSPSKNTKNRYLKQLENLKSDPDLKKLPLFNEVYMKLEKAIDEEFKNEFTANNFNIILSYAFAGDFFNHDQIEKKVEFVLVDDVKNQKFSFTLTEDRNIFNGNKIFNDAIYIDSPVIFQLIKLLNDTAIEDKEYMPTIKDLKQKLLNLPQRVEVWEQKEIQDLAHYIQGVIGGDIENKGTEIVYNKKNDNIPIKIENTATGIKSFGLILLLLKQGYIHDKTVLVFDEPEVHLHPKWQLKMAKLIVSLVEKGVTIVVNSHSPYMIEALKQFSDMNGLDDKTNFYLANEGKINQINDNNSDTLVEIFELLSEPYDFFEDVERSRLEEYLNG